MKKILLVSANRHCVPYPVYPIGVSYLCGYLSKHLIGFEIEVFDCNNSDRELSDVINVTKPDYIGVSLRNVDGANSLDRSNFIPEYKKIIEEIKLCCSAPIILGGSGFSIYPKAIFDELMPDYGIMGEGEISLKKLIEALEFGDDVTNIEGVVCYDERGKFVCNEHKEYLKTLDIEFDKTLVDYYWKESGMLNMQTKRGCPYNCIYCSYPLIDGRCVRTLDTDVIVENLKRLNTETGVNYVFFTDSVFNIHNNYNIELAEKIIKSGLKINWGAYFSPSNLTDEILGLFKASGLTHIEFGTESFSDTQLKNYGKNFKFSDVLECSELCLKHNIYYAHFLILGGYGETEETLRETIENSKKIQYSVFFPYFGMRIYPGTKLHAIALQEGLLEKNNDLLEPAYYIAEGFDVEEIKRRALETEKAWVFPDDKQDEMMDVLRKKRKKKGLLWEYLRKP